MSRPRTEPTYQLHKGSGQARTIIDGKSIYLGKYNSPQSQERFEELKSEWRLRNNIDQFTLTVTKLAGLLEERIEVEGLAELQAPQARSSGKKGKGGRLSGGPEIHPDWYIHREQFKEGKTEFHITDNITGRTLIRGLKHPGCGALLARGWRC